MLDIIKLQKKEFCGFPLRFPLLTYGEYKHLQLHMRGADREILHYHTQAFSQPF